MGTKQDMKGIGSGFYWKSHGHISLLTPVGAQVTQRQMWKMPQALSGLLGVKEVTWATRTDISWMPLHLQPLILKLLKVWCFNIWFREHKFNLYNNMKRGMELGHHDTPCFSISGPPSLIVPSGLCRDLGISENELGGKIHKVISSSWKLLATYFWKYIFYIDGQLIMTGLWAVSINLVHAHLHSGT